MTPDKVLSISRTFGDTIGLFVNFITYRSVFPVIYVRIVLNIANVHIRPANSLVSATVRFFCHRVPGQQFGVVVVWVEDR